MKKDHLVPWKAAFDGMKLFDSEVRFVVGGSGHVAGVVNPPARNKYCYWICGYSVAGGIAGEVASRLADKNEVFCYTFGATNTNTTGSGAYACIKNVINEDDLYPKIYNDIHAAQSSAQLTLGVSSKKTSPLFFTRTVDGVT